MPGIHVRTLGKLDWVERGNEPDLTIPGAYWLCHKKHIYKFTFKWHKTLRNTEHLAYPKELTKVIRRIIKSQPRQGQQFGTRHLLVTYNHSAWMRQDKMFAMLKFRERTDATAFPHAFVLTVKTLNSSTAEELCSADETIDCANTASEVAKNTRLQGIKNGNKETVQDNSQEHSNSILATKNDIESSNKIVTSEKPTEPSSTNRARESETERKKDPGKKTAKRAKSDDNAESAPPVKRTNRRSEPIFDQSEDKEPPISPAKKNIANESADLPYQYIIEKEIEESKDAPKKDCPAGGEAESKVPGPSYVHSHASSLPGKLLPRSPRAAQTDAARSADITDLVMEGLMFTIRQDQDSVTVVEQKTKLEMDEVLENSEKAETKEGEKCLLNSSLLRLESLITKIEMSEARLKNNEAASQSPAARNAEKPFFYSASAGTTRNWNDSPRKYGKSASPHPRSLGPPSTLEMPKFPFVKINLNNVREALNDNLSVDRDAKEEETNQVKDHEAMAMDRGMPRGCRKPNEAVSQEEMEEEEDEEDEVGLELKYDEKDDSESDGAEDQEDCPEKEDEEEKTEDTGPEALEQNPEQNREINQVEKKNQKTSEPLTTPIKSCNEIPTKSKTPRIVSNEIVTDDQIPPDLLKALRFKRATRLFGDNKIVKNTVENPAKATTAETTATSAPAKLSSEVETPTEQSGKRESSENRKTDKPASSKRSTTTLDITEEFEEELSSEKRRKQPPRRKSLRHAEETTSGNTNQSSGKSEIRIEMWKFMQDITRGAKVVVRRLDLADIPNGVANEYSLSKYNVNHRYATES